MACRGLPYRFLISTNLTKLFSGLSMFALYPFKETMNEVDLQDPKLHNFLLGIDRDLAAQARGKGCQHIGCNGTLHSAQYPRKIHGMSCVEGNDQDESKRFSFCCDTCRRRTTPASVRFLGRRVYPAVLVLVLSAMRDGVTGSQATQLRETFGVAQRTLERWRHWWREIFVRTPFWAIARGRFMPILDQGALPDCLIERFEAHEVEARLVQCLRFLGPITAPGYHAT